MNIFKFKINVLKTDHKRKTNNITRRIIEKSVTGKITEDSSTGVIKVEFNDNLYDIHPDSYKTYGKRRVYRKVKNEWIEYDRPCSEDRLSMPNYWFPFRPKYICIGNVVQENDKVYFKIRSCYNKINLDAKAEAIRIIKNEDLMETLNNGDNTVSECTNR